MVRRTIYYNGACEPDLCYVCLEETRVRSPCVCKAPLHRACFKELLWHKYYMCPICLVAFGVSYLPYFARCKRVLSWMSLLAVVVGEMKCFNYSFGSFLVMAYVCRLYK